MYFTSNLITTAIITDTYLFVSSNVEVSASYLSDLHGAHKRDKKCKYSVTNCITFCDNRLFQYVTIFDAIGHSLTNNDRPYLDRNIGRQQLCV